MSEPRYAELHAHSAYTFLEGTCQPTDLVDAALEIGLSGLGVIEVDGMFSAIQSATAAANKGLRCVHGAELTLESGLRLPVLVSSQDGYHDLCAAISAHNLAVPGRRTGNWTISELAEHVRGRWQVLTGTRHGPLHHTLTTQGFLAARRVLDELIDHFGKDHVLVEACLRPDDPRDLSEDLARLAGDSGVRMVATGGARCAREVDQAMADVMTATRLNLSLEAARPHLPAFGSFLRSPEEMLTIHQSHPEAVANAADVAAECAFNLTLMEPRLPKTDVPTGHDDDSWLRHLTYAGAMVRYGSKKDYPRAYEVIDHELGVISRLGFAGYFLIVKDIVDFCRESGILCQGRGSAANSAVCYALGVTAVDAVKNGMLFERFLSEDRREPPDIDIDIESAEREQVIQYVYTKYGRDRAAQVANTISYRPRSAIRAAGKALGFDEDLVGRWAKEVSRGSAGPETIPGQVLAIAARFQKLPRHMGIHPGGMVLTETPVSEICPVMWAAKENRSVLQWDKEDCADAGLVKFDLLGLGMLTALRKAFNALNNLGITGRDWRPLDLYNLPSEDPRVYDLLCAAETVGIFQVESRAQMATLPRLKPRKFYDLVIEVALIRPGPIQGKAVNPYLDRRNGHEEPTCHPLLAPTLKRTLGVPLFQEQLMRIAVDGAGFTPGQADELRRAVGSKRSAERMATLKPQLFKGMTNKGLPPDVQEQIYDSLKGFAEFGFPESHAFSFAHLVYASAWLKTYYPEHFYASILASQPMGFYSPASLIADAKKHGIHVSPPSVVASDKETTAQGTPTTDDLPDGQLIRAHESLTVRLGFETIKGLPASAIDAILTGRAEQPFNDLKDFAYRTHLSAKHLELLARAGAFDDFHLSRREALWQAQSIANPSEYRPYLPGTEPTTDSPVLPGMDELSTVQTDYTSLGMTTRTHPIALMRNHLTSQGIITIKEASTVDPGRIVTIAGTVTHRQRPGTARGVTFLSLEDETGLANTVFTVGAWTRFRSTALSNNLVAIRGMIERKDGAWSIQTHSIRPLVPIVAVRSRDFH